MLLENTGGGLFLASGSQDSMIRLWKFTTEENTNDSTSNEETLQLEQKKINVSKQDGSNLVYVIQTESVISGHDGWIYGVNWKSKSCSGNVNYICLLDYNIVIYFYYLKMHIFFSLHCIYFFPANENSPVEFYSVFFV